MVGESIGDLTKRISIVEVLNRYVDSNPMSTRSAFIRLPCILCDYQFRSLSINTKKNSFVCYHCGSKGNILDLTMVLEGVDEATAGALLRHWFPLQRPQ